MVILKVDDRVVAVYCLSCWLFFAHFSYETAKSQGSSTKPGGAKRNLDEAGVC
jgi:hypothetical protein